MPFFVVAAPPPIFVAGSRDDHEAAELDILWGRPSGRRRLFEDRAREKSWVLTKQQRRLAGFYLVPDSLIAWFRLFGTGLPLIFIGSAMMADMAEGRFDPDLKFWLAGAGASLFALLIFLFSGWKTPRLAHLWIYVAGWLGVALCLSFMGWEWATAASEQPCSECAADPAKNRPKLLLLAFLLFVWTSLVAPLLLFGFMRRGILAKGRRFPRMPVKYWRYLASSLYRTCDGWFDLYVKVMICDLLFVRVRSPRQIMRYAPQPDRQTIFTRRAMAEFFMRQNRDERGFLTVTMNMPRYIIYFLAPVSVSVIGIYFIGTLGIEGAGLPLRVMILGWLIFSICIIRFQRDDWLVSPITANESNLLLPPYCYDEELSKAINQFHDSGESRRARTVLPLQLMAVAGVFASLVGGLA